VSALLRDIFTIPETTSTADYVLRLTESVDEAHLARTLDDYVVTDELARAFDTGLGVVADAIATNTSKGAFLTGSFGSGKSHFMAVLYALLRQHPQARAIPDLAGAIGRHDPQLQGRQLLPLTFHLLGAQSMEQALFDGYLRQIAELRPDATPPLLHQTARLLEDADTLRRRMGDETFFEGLNEGSGGGGDVWGAVLGEAGTWDAAGYEAARAASADDGRRAELVAALQRHYFAAYTSHATHVGLDEGLTAISAHAQSLGYDAVVLFLDELVLWLAFRIRDHAFFGTETQKLTKLVEGGQGGRRIPLVSFVARQMDLRRWLADSGASGAEQQALEQSFNFQEGRFRTIRLGDDNLPYVAHKRLLAPRDAAADAEIDHAFARLDRRTESWDVLLDGINTDERHRGADAAQFRLTYPFSPALVSTLRSLAGVMQRERTALKVMQQMLVDGRDTLTIDDVMPVGDAFDYLVTGAAGDQPLDEASAALFRAAHTLFRERLAPMILKDYDLTEAEVRGGIPRPPAMDADLRLAKTLLLSAVAPNVPALRALTAGRLASLNHGSIRSPLPNGEAAVVLAKVRTWGARVPEIRVESEGRNPLISVQLSDVDYESVVDRARGEDNDGRRRDLIKRLVAESFGLDDLGAQDLLGGYTHRLIWRGSAREVGLVFGNVRDAGWLTDEHFRAAEGTWKFVIDHPFDEPGHSASEDHARIDGLRARNWDEHTIVWLPRFFTDDRLKDVSRLVVLNYLLEGSGDRYATYADHLSETGRVQARAILQAQREALLHRIRQAIQVAYDVESPLRGGDVVDDVAHPEVLSSLTPTFTPQTPAGGTLRQAFERLVQDAFATTYPAHPRFEPGDVEVRARELAACYDYVERALADREGRVPLGHDAAAVRRIANPLGVGKAAETHFLMGDEYFGIWGLEFERRLGSRGEDGRGPVTVGEVRGWIRAIAPPLGLTRDVADLVILAWAALRRRAWFAHGAPLPVPKPGALRDEMELRVQAMPDAVTWTSARALAGSLFGITGSAYVTPAEVANLASAVHGRAVELTQPAHRLVGDLERARDNLRMSEAEGSGRLATARAMAELCDGLRGLQGLPLIERLAAADVPEGTKAGRSLETATNVSAQLEGFSWGRFRPLLAGAQGEGAHAEEAAGVLRRLGEALDADEFNIPLAPALKLAEDELFAWLAPRATTPTDDASTGPTTRQRPSASGRVTIHRGQGTGAVAAQLDRFVSEHPDTDIVVEWRAE
jgi:hypothetical protein